MMEKMTFCVPCLFGLEGLVGDELRRLELDVPQPTELCDVLRRAGVPLPAGVLTVEQCVDALAAAWEV